MTRSRFRAQAPECRRAFLLNVTNGGLYIFAETLIDPNLVLVLFASQLTDSNLLLGAISAISSGGWFLPQLFVSGWVQTQPRKILVYRKAAIARMITWLALVVVLWFVREPFFLLAFFYLSYAAMQVMSGLGGIPFMDIVAKTIPQTWCARLFGWRLLIAGVLSVLGSRIVTWVLTSSLPYPRNYALLIFLASLLGGVAMLAFSLTREPPGPTREAASVLSQVRRGFQALRDDANYCNLLWGRSLLFLGLISIPFYTLLARRVLGAPDAVAGNYLAVTTATTLLVNLPLGWLVDRKGKRWGLRTAALGWAGTALLGLLIAWAAQAGLLQGLSFPAYFLAYPLFALRGLFAPLDNLAGHTLLLHVAPENDRALYLGFTNTWLGVVLLLSGLGGGLVDLLGFEALFGTIVGVNLLAFYFFGRITERS